MRKNIFEIIDEKEIDFAKEISRVDIFISYRKLIHDRISLENYFNSSFFIDWKYKKNKLNLFDFKEDSGIDEIIENEEPDIFDFLIYMH